MKKTTYLVEPCEMVRKACAVKYEQENRSKSDDYIYRDSEEKRMGGCG